MPTSTRHQAHALAQSVGEVVSHTHEAINEAVAQGKHKAGTMYGRASEKLGQWKDRGAQSVQAMRGTVRRNTMTSMLIAFGVGFILARTVFRRA